MDKEAIDYFVRTYCNRFPGEASAELLKHLIRKGITSPKRVRDYVIVSKFYDMLPEYKYYRTGVYYELSNQFGLTVRQIQRTIKKGRQDFNLSDE